MGPDHRSEFVRASVCRAGSQREPEWRWIARRADGSCDLDFGFAFPRQRSFNAANCQQEEAWHNEADFCDSRNVSGVVGAWGRLRHKQTQDETRTGGDFGRAEQSFATRSDFRTKGDCDSACGHATGWGAIIVGFAVGGAARPVSSLAIAGGMHRGALATLYGRQRSGFAPGQCSEWISEMLIAGWRRAAFS